MRKILEGFVLKQHYEFEFENMEFSKDGGLDELIALDRYAIPTYEGYKTGDTVVAIVDDKGSKRVGKIMILKNGKAVVEDRFGDTHEVELDLLHKPLETKPSQLWERWAKGGSSVEETMTTREFWENEFRWLFDGYRYSLGGRIQLMLGQEFVTGQRANLTAYNCFVARSPESLENPMEQFLDGLEVAYKEASIMRRGGGVGINISTFNTISGSGATESDFIFYLDNSHADYKELLQRIRLGKFKGVTIVTTQEEFDNAIIERAKTRNVFSYNAVDSVDDGLFDNMKNMAEFSYKKYSVAINFNDLRKRNAIVKGVNGRSSGSVSWMELFVLIAQLLQQETIDCVDFAEVFSAIVHLIIQGGSRRGALMLICNSNNPHIVKFITRKREMGYLSGANISVGIDDTFMNNVKLAKSVVEANAESVYCLNADLKQSLEIWNLIIESAHASAEPGVVWLERYNKESNSWYFHYIICTNPCGEQGLPAWGVCNLGHHVLPRYYVRGKSSLRGANVSNKTSLYFYPKYEELEKYPQVDWDSLARACHTSQRLQDNIIDYTDYFMEENRETQMKERRVGIGSMGLGTLMIKLELRYGSDEGNEFIDTLYKFIAYQHYMASIKLAEEKGAFPAYEYEKFIQSGFMKRMLSEFPSMDELLKKYGIRNVTSLTQAPTGSTATYIDYIPLFVELFGGTTTGVEPYFAFEFWRASRLGFAQQICHIALQYMEKNGLGSIDELPEWFVTAMELSPADHVKVQAAIQKWTDSSISKTANAPRDFTVEQTDELYMLSYDLGLKGMTIYRDSSREAQVLAVDKEDAKLEVHIEAEKLAEMEQGDIEKLNFLQEYEAEWVGDKEATHEFSKRPSRLYGFTEKVKVPFGDKMVKAYININVDEDGQPFEVFITSNTKEFEEMASVIGRLVTRQIRTGDNIDEVAKQLRKGQTMVTLPAKLATLLEHVAYGKIEVPIPSNVKIKKGKPKMVFQKCSKCGEQAFDKANCICVACGDSKCN